MDRLRSRDRRRQDVFWNLVATARHLQGPRGCPWDRAQTVPSLLPHLVEEVWEAFCAVRKQRRAHVQEELGDVLYTVVFLALIAEGEGWWSLVSLLEKTRQKMKRRHPHVFGLQHARTAQEAYTHWQAAKQREGLRHASGARLRPLLVELWETLQVRRNVPRTIRQMLQRFARAPRTVRHAAHVPGRPNRPSSRPSAMPAQGTGRSSSQGVSRVGAD